MFDTRYCAVCGSPDTTGIRARLDGGLVDYCRTHGVWGRLEAVCAKPVTDRLSCALTAGHDGPCRRAYQPA
jgi:hypothetical protein